MKNIRHAFNQLATQTEEDWNYFRSKLKEQKFSKNSLILKQGEVENNLSYVENGIIRLYIPNLDNDITIGFAFPGDFVSAYDSFLERTACLYQVQALSETTLLQVKYQDLQEIYKNTQIGNEIGRKSAEKLFLIKSKRELSFLTKSAEKRYLDLFEERPKLIKHIPLKYLASYIGITPQALSRIRKRIS